ncbi:hypothetical protein [Inquilinus sp. CA228]
MSFWQLACCIDGHNRINGAKKPGGIGGGMTAERFAELMPKS